MISFYDLFMRPLEKRGLAKTRQSMMEQARGNVLEIGAGTGANLSSYKNKNITSLIVTDKKPSKHLDVSDMEHTSIVEADATTLPFSDNQFDTVVHTLVFCSVDDVDQGLSEIRRVLKQDGQLLFIEHVLPEKKGIRRFFKLINPLWRVLASGCSLTKDYRQSLQDNGFSIVEDGRFMNTVFYYGIARINTDKSTSSSDS